MLQLVLIKMYEQIKYLNGNIKIEKKSYETLATTKIIHICEQRYKNMT